MSRIWTVIPGRPNETSNLRNEGGMLSGPGSF